MLPRVTRIARWLAAAGLSLATVSCTAPEPPPASVSLALVNGRIWTGDPARPWVDAMAVSNGRIVAVGTSDAIELLADDAEVIDVRRRLVFPGFIDTHTHLLDLGSPPGTLNLATVRSRRQLVSRVSDAAASRPPGTWLLGREWDHRLWGDTLPHRDWIDAISPDHPVWLVQRDEQMGLANSLALDRAGIVVGMSGAQTGGADPANLRLTGIVTGPALRQLEAAVPPAPPAASPSSMRSARRPSAA